VVALRYANDGSHVRAAAGDQDDNIFHS
jgi:hypothetical protein